MLKESLAEIMRRRKCTLLGAGPMSANCVDAAIELANQYNAPIMLIASRRQVDSAQHGGGYVENWTTKDFADYVLDHDKRGKIILARDHGGPWQNPQEIANNLGLRRAMQSAKDSYAEDIAAGFQIIHIDPSVDIHGTPSQREILERIFELYEFCWSEARRVGQEIIFEIGTEEQSGSADGLEEMRESLTRIYDFCSRNRLPKPSFVVMQTGTKVVEMRNVGVFDQPFRVSGEIPAEIQIPRMLRLCRDFDIWLKQHNTDYLTDETLSWHPQMGIHAANVAPEFGVAETVELLRLLRSSKLDRLADRFLQLSLDSRKWHKWLAPQSEANDEEKAVLAGHYVFADPECLEIKAEADAIINRSGCSLNFLLKECVKKSIYRYLVNFRMVDSL